MIKKKSSGHIALLLTNIIFGVNTTISRFLVPEVVHPLVIAFLRVAGAAILFWTASLFVKKEKVPKKDILLMLLASIFGIGLNQTFFIVGLSMTSPIDAAIEQTFLPILSMFLAAYFLKEPITWKKAIGVAIGAAGVLMLIFGQGIGSENRNLMGNIIVFIGVLAFSIYLTLFKKLIDRYSPVTLMKWMFLFASIYTFPISFKYLLTTDFLHISIENYLKIGFVITFATFICYLLLPIGQKTLRPTTVSMYSYVQPIVAAFVAIGIGMETFTFDKLLAGILVFCGVFLVTKSKSKAQIDAEKQQLDSLDLH